MSEQNSNMDELLKAHAKKRRDEAGPVELHPATRKMLQAEAHRLHAKKADAQEKAEVPAVVFKAAPMQPNAKTFLAADKLSTATNSLACSTTVVDSLKGTGSGSVSGSLSSTGPPVSFDEAKRLQGKDVDGASF